ncbi:glycosyltransferase family 8 protein [Peribacillus frigoritolerans]|uniref:glycosyltransferase family 8 protein n=1 Tax=Peribacillus frigoritolerans TaxID=450367 RepID=UPI003D2BA958
MEVIHLAAATNDEYALYLGVMLESLLANKVSKNPLKIYILYENISKQNKFNLNEIVRKYNQDICFISMANSMYDGFKVTEYITKEMYYRISISDLLDPNINKVLYLDCDLVVKKDITKLWKTEMGDYFVAAVESASRNSRKEDLLIPDSYGYFNSGVLLINLAKWRQHNISNNVIDFIKNNPSKLIYPDQDALNAILYDKWLQLNPKWNYTSAHAKRLKKRNPAIIHFTGKKKPFGHLLEKEFFYYLNKITWDKTQDR